MLINSDCTVNSFSCRSGFQVDSAVICPQRISVSPTYLGVPPLLSLFSPPPTSSSLTLEARASVVSDNNTLNTSMQTPGGVPRLRATGEARWRHQPRGGRRPREVVAVKRELLALPGERNHSDPGGAFTHKRGFLQAPVFESLDEFSPLHTTPSLVDFKVWKLVLNSAILWMKWKE